MTTFTKWFLLNALVLTSSVLAEVKGMISLMIKSDSSYLTIVIIALYFIMSGFVGRLSYLADRINPKSAMAKDDSSSLMKKTDVAWFAAEHFFSLGLLGTVVGLCIATATSLTSNAQLGEVVSSLKVGLNTAFYTTICGIVYSIPLQIQIMILKYKLEEIND